MHGGLHGGPYLKESFIWLDLHAIAHVETVVEHSIFDFRMSGSWLLQALPPCARIKPQGQLSESSLKG